MRWTIVVAWLLIVTPRPAYAQPARDASDAATAYDRGAAAYDHKDYPTAATELARADALVPNDVTLGLAIGAAVLADEAALAMTLVERADARPRSKDLAAIASSARSKTASSVGKLHVVCADPCRVTLDGAPFEASKARFVRVGAHHVGLVRTATQGGGEPETFDVTIEAGKAVELVPGANASPARPTDEPRARRGVSPAWFWIAAGATTLVGAATVLSGIDTVAKHDDFTRDRSDAGAAERGRDADRRTSILVAVTSVAILGTAVLGALFVDWSRGRTSSAIRAFVDPTF